MLIIYINYETIVYIQAYLHMYLYMYKETWGNSYRGENHTLLIIAT